MEGTSGIDTGTLALLQNNNDDDKILKWLITLGFLGRRGGVLGNEDHGAAAGAGVRQSDVDAAKHAGETNAKLDCLQQGQQDAMIAAHNSLMINLFHTAETARCQGNQALSAQLSAVATQMAACCCDLKQGQAEIKCGQESIKNEILRSNCTILSALCDQTNTLVTAGTNNTQRIVDTVNEHANAENAAKLADCQAALSNCQQTSALNQQTAMLVTQIAELKACACNTGNGNGNGNGHGNGRKSAE